MSVCVCTCGEECCTPTRGHRKVSGVLLYHPLPRFLETGSYRAQSSPFLLDLLAASLQDSPVFPAPYATGTSGYVWLLCGCQEFKLKSSWPQISFYMYLGYYRTKTPGYPKETQWKILKHGAIEQTQFWLHFKDVESGASFRFRFL